MKAARWCRMKTRALCGPFRCFVAGGAATIALFTATPARAEYAENEGGRSIASLTLATAGATALGFDIGDTIYLAMGPGHHAGRIVTGIGSFVGACGLIGGGAFALAMVGDEHVPGGDPNSA